jgi:MinD superfamily P-loop ATPase
LFYYVTWTEEANQTWTATARACSPCTFCSSSCSSTAIFVQMQAVKEG